MECHPEWNRHWFAGDFKLILINQNLKILCCSFVFLFPVSTPAQTIFIDENFSDWESISSFYDDASGDNSGYPIDFKTLKIYNDDKYIYFYLEVGAEINLQEGNNISLLIDLDSNSETGEFFSGIGYEFIFNFGQRNGQFFDPQSSGFNSYDIGLVSAPTVSSTVFEIKIDRDAEIDGTPLFTSQSFDFLFRSSASNGDLLPDNGSGTLTYVLNNDNAYEEQSYSLKKRNSNDLRVLSYNVERDNLFNPSAKENFRRIFQAIDADIIGLEEVYENSGEQAVSLIEEFLPSETGEQWYSGDVGNDNLIVSRYPVIKQKSLSGNAAYLLDLGDKKLLAIVAHPPCCGNNNGRQREIDEFMAFVRDSKSGSEFDIEANTPIVIMGDMNLVGFADQQATLISGDIIDESSYGADFIPDWDNTNLEDLKPVNPGLPTTFTWYSSGSSFSAGRLDYIVYTGSVMEANNGFSLFTSDMHPDSLISYGLEKEDVVLASDHLPIVGDFSFKLQTRIDEAEETPLKFKLFQNYPNPFNPATTIQFQLHKTAYVKLDIFDALGRKVETLVEEVRSAGTQTVNFEADSYSSGVYYYTLRINGNSVTKKMILAK